MNLITINGSPRKNWNTHTLLKKAMEGAASRGAQTELINLYELSYKGCISCLGCKRNDGASIGKCVINDDLKPVLEKIALCDALLLGSPIYFGEVTGAMRSFLERLLFQYISYEKERAPYFNRRIQTGFIFTMNAPESALEKIGYTDTFKAYAALLERVLGPSKTLISAETLQVEDYSKYRMSGINEEERKARRESVFLSECQKAFDLGAQMCR